MLSILDALADLLCGATCPGCLRPGLSLCSQCRAALSGPAQLTKREIAVPLAAAAPYRPVLAHVIPRYKDDGALHLDRLLGRLLAKAVLLLEPPAHCVLVPVPSLPQTVRARGFDHCLRLARVAAASTGLRVARGLTRVGSGRDQRELGRAGRKDNVTGSMRGRNLQLPAVIVDDVVTSGASLWEASTALRAAGTHVLAAAVVADADRDLRLGDDYATKL